MNWPTLDSNESAVIELGLNTTMFSVVNASTIDADCFTADFRTSVLEIIAWYELKTSTVYGGPDY